MLIEVEWIDIGQQRALRTVGNQDRFIVLLITPYFGGEYAVTTFSGIPLKWFHSPQAAQAFAEGLFVRHEPAAPASPEQTTNTRTSPRTPPERFYKP